MRVDPRDIGLSHFEHHAKLVWPDQPDGQGEDSDTDHNGDKDGGNFIGKFLDGDFCSLGLFD